MDPVAHYIQHGFAEGRNPTTEFCSSSYLIEHPDVRASKMNPFLHYVDHGRDEGRPIGRHPIPDDAFERLQATQAHRLSERHALFDFLYQDGTRDSPKSPLFDDLWYSELYGIPQEAAQSHYKEEGWRLGHRPHPLFNVAFYRASCARKGMAIDGNPLDHYLHIGARAGVSPNRLFDPDWYGRELERVVRKRDDSSLHDYLIHGHHAGLDPHPLFSSAFYIAQGAVDPVSPLLHFVMVGWSARRATHPLLDPVWFFANNPDAARASVRSVDHLSHYLMSGTDPAIAPHPRFDARWYSQLHGGDPAWGRTPLEHFVSKGERPVARMSKTVEFDFARGEIVENQRWHADGVTPLVSIIIVNMNGTHHLDALFASLSDQTYQNVEVIFVDNASHDGSREKVEQLCPAAKIIALDRNAGFAEANNIGMEASKGELIALLNNDTRVDTNWLSELIFALGRWPDAGAATSRVRFWKKFVHVRLSSPKSFILDLGVLYRSLDYRKCITNVGEVIGSKVKARLNGREYEIELKVPHGEVAAEFLAEGAADLTSIRLAVGTSQFSLGSQVKRVIDLSKVPERHAAFVINNAGSHEPGWLKTGDIGFGEFDHGQRGREVEVALACGCAMIVRRSALLGKTLFASDFVAYFEDSELSRRLRRSGHSIVYAPGAIAYHRHSSTTSEHSPFWHKQIRRNGALYKYMELPRADRHAFLHHEMMDLNHYLGWLGGRPNENTPVETAVHGVLPQVMSELKQLCAKVDAGTILGRSTAKRIGIYDSFWNTRGGGEAHALFFATYLAQFDLVDLISETDFDLDALGSYFNCAVGRFRKRLVGRMTTAITGEYDVFINSTYMSEMPSIAENSFFIVSFPSKTPSEAFLRSYQFLANSPYTQRWIERYWGSTPSVALVEPVVQNALISPPTPKKKIILSVGRFFRDGHSKNQLEIVRAFRAAALGDEWLLALVGSIGDRSYYDEVCAAAHPHRAEANINIYPDASFETVKQLYAEAAIYVHASGLGRDPESEPENFEHFGMTVAEACANGCYPIVFNAAGPADIVKRLGNGAVYSSEVEMGNAFRVATSMMQDHSAIRHLSSNAYMAKNRMERLEKILVKEKKRL